MTARAGTPEEGTRDHVANAAQMVTMWLALPGYRPTAEDLQGVLDRLKAALDLIALETPTDCACVGPVAGTWYPCAPCMTRHNAYVGRGQTGTCGCTHCRDGM